MPFTPRRGVRRAVVAAVVVPLVAVLVLAASVAWSAEQDRRAAVELQRRTTALVASGELGSALDAELGVYDVWLSEVDTGRRSPAGGSTITEQGDQLVQILQAQVDQAIDGLAASSELVDPALPGDVAAQTSTLREAWDDRDADRLRTELTAVRSDVVERLRSVVRALAEGDADLTLLAELQLATTELTLEGTAASQALSAGRLDPGARDDLLVRIDRTDRSLASTLRRLPDDLAVEATEITASVEDGAWARLRRRALALPATADADRPLDEIGTTTLLIGTAQLTSAIGELGERLSARESQAARADAAAAATERNVVLGLALAIVIGSIAVAVRNGRRLTTRIETLAETARRVADGDLDATSPDRPVAERADELDALGATFDELRLTVSNAQRQVVALAEGRFDDPVLAVELPGAAGADLRVGLRRLGTAAAELARRADRDSLTDLLTQEAFEQAVGALLREERPVVVVYIDLDDFKPVNDTHGHLAGDEVLLCVAKRLRALVRSDDPVARLGGDEFAFAVQSEDDAAVGALLERAVTQLSEPIHLSMDAVVTIGASVGGARRAPGEDVTSLLHRADEQMYSAKRAGKNRALLSV